MAFHSPGVLHYFLQDLCITFSRTFIFFISKGSSCSSPRHLYYLFRQFRDQTHVSCKPPALQADSLPDGKASAYNVGDLGSIPGLGRSPREGNGNHSCILAWRIPQAEEPGGLQSIGSQSDTTEMTWCACICILKLVCMELRSCCLLWAMF